MAPEQPTVEALQERICKIHHRPLSGNTFYRDAPVASYAIHGTGPLQGLTRGARYSPPDTFPILYFSAERLQSQLETAHHINRLVPRNPDQDIQDLHSSLTSLQAEKLHKHLQEMAASEQGFVEDESLSEYLSIAKVKELFYEDPSRLLAFLEMVPFLTTPLSTRMDCARINIATRITARGILDLTDRSVLEELQISVDEITGPTEEWLNATAENFTLTQRIGLAAWDAPAVDGILFPSALSAERRSTLVSNSANLALFMHEEKPHLPRSGSVAIEIEDEFVQLTKLFWTNRPEWLMKALETYEPNAAKILRRLG